MGGIVEIWVDEPPPERIGHQNAPGRQAVDEVRHGKPGGVALLRQVILVGQLQGVQSGRVGPAGHEVAHIGVFVPARCLPRRE